VSSKSRVPLAALAPASPHLVAHRAMLAESARLGPIADLACGRGRQAIAAARWGLPVVGVDRNPQFLRELLERSRDLALPIECVLSDLEAPSPLPLTPGSCGAVLVFRFLFRPLAPLIEGLLAPGGLLLYETFTLAQADREGGPNNPAFLLAPGELARLFPGLETLACTEGAATACLAARKPR